MRAGSVRAGTLLVGVAAVCAIPAVATGQIDPGQTIDDTVDSVGKAVPQSVPEVKQKLPSLPSTGTSKPSAQSPAGSAPHSGTTGQGGGSASTRSSSGSSARAGGGSGSSSSSRKSSAAKDRSSSKGGKAGESRALGQRGEAGDATKKAAASPAGEVRPATGAEGDPKLPFTGYALIAVALIGGIALLVGFGLRGGGGRLRFARRRA
jgi:hypothetical protein